MKKLLYITTHLQNSGGVARILSVKLNYLVETFHYEISVINSNHDNASFFYNFNSKINIFPLDAKGKLGYKKQLNNLVNTIQPDFIINCDNGFKGALLPYLITSKAPLFYERHCSKYISAGTLKERFLLKCANLVTEKSIHKYQEFIVLNKFEKEDWSRKDVLVIPNPIWFKTPSERILNKKNIAVAVGRHAYEKRYDKLLHIWKKVVENNPDWVLKIYGEKNNKINLKSHVEALHLNNSVMLCEPINDLNKIYSEASMLLATSESESFPLVFIEAKAFGLPIIAFENYGSKTLVEDNVNGFLIGSNNIQSYVEKTKHLISGLDLQKRLGENAKKSLAKLDIDAIMAVWHKLFQA
ncbi:glycosyltransferase [Algibacter miyuki]|uniref:Glycosyltransferase n=1 Tax=Algibacter miyuki TaxID=1306933 RepID=A0ABV5GXN5_9FLAO|nr:glycosyltransferase [Algibacter miyuki]MDN3665900.1 glycosyltransferase [Algibacter miyuki]